MLMQIMMQSGLDGCMQGAEQSGLAKSGVAVVL